MPWLGAYALLLSICRSTTGRLRMTNGGGRASLSGRTSLGLSLSSEPTLSHTFLAISASMTCACPKPGKRRRTWPAITASQHSVTGTTGSPGVECSSGRSRRYLRAGARILIEQTYPGAEDDRRHFEHVLPAFRDCRYFRVDGKPLFYVFRPEQL